jgi:hypothetical protein
MEKKNITAAALILLGLLFLLRSFRIMDGEFVLFVISLGFFVGYFMSGGMNHRGNVGLLIPACIILCIGIFAVLDNLLNLNGAVFFLLLGSAFFMVYFIHTFHLKHLSFGSRNWPAITGASLYAFGTFILLLEYYELPIINIILQYALPVGLIIAGLIIIFQNLTSKN